MKIGLDTSVVVRLLIGEPADMAEIAWQEVATVIARRDDIVVTDLVVSEAYFALQYHYGVPKNEVLNQLRLFLESANIKAIGTAGRVLAIPNLATANPGFVDRLIQAQYTANADQMLTFEKAAGKLPKVRVLRG